MNPFLARLGYGPDDRVVIIHADDVGMCQASLAAFADMVAFGLVSSGSTMVPCSWFPAAAAFCRANPEVDMGVHVTLTCEWDAYRWGPISFGIPDNWGAAAVVYAVIEGLVGVVDDGVAYDRVTLSPRWTEAGVQQATAAVKCPASNGYLAYRYHHDQQGGFIELEITGSGEACACHVLLPQGVPSVSSVSAGDRFLDFRVTRVEQSHYVDFDICLPGPHRATIEYTDTEA